MLKNKEHKPPWAVDNLLEELKEYGYEREERSREQANLIKKQCDLIINENRVYIEKLKKIGAYFSKENENA